MEYFIILIYLIFLVFWFDIREKTDYKKTNYYILLIIFILFAGLRYRIGGDTMTYMYNFDTVMVDLNKLTLSDLTETRYQPLCVLLFSLSKSCGDNFFVFQIIAAAITNISIFNFFSKVCTKYFTSITIYFICNYIYFNMEIMREAMALSMLLYGFLALGENKFVKFYLFVLFAYLFHPFAAIIGIAPFFTTSKISLKIKLIAIVGLSCFMFVINLNEFIFIKLLPYLPIQVISDTIDMYADNDAATTSFFSFKGLLVVLASFPFLAIFVYKYKLIYNKGLIMMKRDVFLSLLFLYIIFVLISVQIPIAKRITNYLWCFSAVAIGSLFFEVNYRNLFSKVMVLFSAFVIMVAWQIRIYSHEQDSFPLYVNYYPYYSVFSKEISYEREIAHNIWKINQ